MPSSDIDPRETILFVGAGASMQLGLPSWPELVGEIGEQLGFDADIFRDFSTSLALAEYYQIEKGSLRGLATLLDRKWHGSVVSVEGSALHHSIVELGFPRIYTTNFDRWLERAFEHWKRDYHKIVKVSDIVDSRTSVTDLVKFHGDFDDPESLVLTESNYFDRLEFESPLDIMLRADALHRPILFIGYSLADVNMRYLFHKLGKLWSDPKISDARKESFIFMARPNPIEEALFRRWGITPIIDPKGDGSGLVDFLNSLHGSPTAPQGTGQRHQP
jgi:SIR2-like domain